MNNTNTSLTAKQLKAIELLIQGLSDTEIAKELNVSRTTLYNWKSKDFNFIAEYNKSINELNDLARNKRIKILNQAYDVIQKNLETELKKKDPDPEIAFKIINKFDIPSNKKTDSESLENDYNLFNTTHIFGGY